MTHNKHFIREVRRYLLYSLSFPERMVRSLAALAGGASTLVTDTVLPKSIRGTTIYNVSVGMMQRFILEKVACIEGINDDGRRKFDDDYLLRKMAGTALEAAGLMTMRLSPLWVFAVAGDAAGGSKIFIERLVRRLKQNGVIAGDAQAGELIDLLEAIQDATAASAVSVDTPPLTRKQLAEIADEMKSNYGRVFKTTTDLIPKFNEIWERMEDLAKRERISVERLGGIITVDALSWSKKGLGTVSAAGLTGAELFDEKILDCYRKTLAEVSGKGLDAYMRTHMRPFMRSAKSHFSPGRRTWIESKFRKPD